MDFTFFVLTLAAGFLSGAFGMLVLLSPSLVRYQKDLAEAWKIIGQYRSHVFTVENKSKETLWRN